MTPERDDVAAVGIERRLDRRDVHRFSHDAMATVFEVYTRHADRGYAAQAAQAAFDLIDRLERELSRFIPNSDITRINNLGAGEATRVSATTLECLLIARHMFDVTSGAFDISIGTGLPSLELDADTFVVRATEQGVRLDLGGIGKGYAVDLMAELLEEWGLSSALLHGGFSSVLALQPPPDEEAWPLTLSDPLSPSRVLARLSVRQTALSASGVRKGEHILDPRTGWAARGRIGAWVALPRPDTKAAGSADTSGGGAPRLAAAAVADALTTAFMVLRPDEVEALCARTPGLEAWILTEPGRRASAECDLLHFAGPDGGAASVP